MRKKSFRTLKMLSVINNSLPTSYFDLDSLACILYKYDGFSLNEEIGLRNTISNPFIYKRYKNQAYQIMKQAMDLSSTIYKSEMVGDNIFYSLNEKGRKLFTQTSI